MTTETGTAWQAATEETAEAKAAMIERTTMDRDPGSEGRGLVVGLGIGVAMIATPFLIYWLA